jgi:hypothetical protein
MQKTNLTLKEICEQTYHIFEMRGYEPKYLDEDQTNFSCLINGIKFSFCSLEDDLFWFGADFKLNEALSDEERASLEQLYMQTEPEDVVFENLHIDGTEVCLSSAFPGDFYDSELIDLVIKTLENADGIVSNLKAKQVG